MKNSINSFFESTARVVMFQKLVQAFCGGMTAVFVTSYLSANEQGYYYTMGSLVSSYILLDLGLSSLLIQISAKHFSNLTWSHLINLNYISDNKTYFLNLFSWVVKWYSMVGVITLGLVPIGYFYFKSAKLSTEVHWQLPWVIAVLCTAISMPAVGYLSILEGAEKIRVCYRLRIIHYTVGGGLTWLLLLFGGGVYSISVAPVVMALVIYSWSLRKDSVSLIMLFKHKGNYNWRGKLWGHQKKVSLNWLSNYLFLHVPVPLVFYFSDAKVAGQLGLSMVIGNVLGAVAMSWVTAITPEFSSLVAKNNVNEARQVFKKAFIRLMVFIILISLTFVFFESLVQGLPVADRLLPPISMLLVLGAFGGFYIISSVIMFFRAFGSEPLAISGFIFTLVITILEVIVIQKLGINAMLILMVIGYAFFAIYSILLLNSFYRNA